MRGAWCGNTGSLLSKDLGSIVRLKLTRPITQLWPLGGRALNIEGGYFGIVPLAEIVNPASAANTSGSGQRNPAA